MSLCAELLVTGSWLCMAARSSCESCDTLHIGALWLWLCLLECGVPTHPVGGLKLLEVEHPDMWVCGELVDIEGGDVAKGGHCVEMLDWIHSARERGMGRDRVRWEEADDTQFGCA
ncbi:hypothetical protein B0H14DRAFT_2565110 [Mycena olivaceomarginata]|nr:hypothetical protein B0H14DRAFT_2565110 [Mycena olivaceomarginata]